MLKLFTGCTNSKGAIETPGIHYSFFKAANAASVEYIFVTGLFSASPFNDVDTSRC